MPANKAGFWHPTLTLPWPKAQEVFQNRFEKKQTDVNFPYKLTADLPPLAFRHAGIGGVTSRKISKLALPSPWHRSCSKSW
jgi:hypothetical protein